MYFNENICPNCNHKMKPIYSIDYDLEDDEIRTDFISGYQCKKCKIQYHFYNCTWSLPYNLQPTKRQINTIRFIHNRGYGLNEFPITKQQCWCFIKTYFEDAKKSSQHQNDYFDYDDYEYYIDEPF